MGSPHPQARLDLRLIPILILLLPPLDIALTLLVARSLPRPLVLLWIALSCLLGGFLILSARSGLRHPKAGALDIALAARQLVRLVAGVLLLFPGPLSDLLAALLVFPRSRQRMTAWALSRTLGVTPSLFEKMGYGDAWPPLPPGGAFGGPPRKEGYVRDAEFEVVSDGDEAPPGGRGGLPEGTKPQD